MMVFRYFFLLIWPCVLISCVATNPLREVALKKQFGKHTYSEQKELLFSLREGIASNTDFGTPKKVYWPLLIKRLKEITSKNSHPLVRTAALEVLGSLLGVQGQADYLKSLKDPSFIVRYQSLKILQKYNNNLSFEPLIKTLKEDLNFHCRRESAKALAHIEAPQLAAKLISAMEKEENLGVSYQIYRALLQVTGEKIPFDLELWKEWQKKRSGNKNTKTP